MITYDDANRTDLGVSLLLQAERLRAIGLRFLQEFRQASQTTPSKGMTELIEDILLGSALASNPVFVRIDPIWHCQIGIAGEGDADAGSICRQGSLDGAIDSSCSRSQDGQRGRNSMLIDLIC